MQDATYKILTIDDDYTVRENIVAYLEDSGFDVCEAENGALGLEVFRQENPDLVLVDLRMPVMEGTEVVSILKKEAPDIPVIVVSGVGVLEEAVEALRLGAWDFVTKPITDMKVLEHAINKALERAQLLEERKQYHQRLEQQVALRTQELRETNERLIEFQAQIQEKNQFLEALIESIPNPVFYKNLQGEYLGCNSPFCQVLGMEQENVVGMTAQELLPDEETCTPFNLEEEHEELDACEMQITSPQGQDRTLVLYKSFFFDRDGEKAGEVGTFHDITELRRQEARIRHQAHHDELTTLPNRLFAKKEIGQHIASRNGDPHKLAVLFMDLDNFKNINDSLGHQTGDNLLKQASERLTQLVGDRGMVARLGGDEFLILLPYIQDETEATVMADAVLRLFRQPFNVDNHELHITTSIGITCYPTDGDDPDTLIKHADIAMYRAKSGDRARWKRFDNSMVEQVERRLAMEKNIRKALENNEFVPFYQPRVDLSTGEVVGMEALARWVRPDGSVVSPAEFIPVAEETGLIVALGEVILNAACKDTKKWHEAGVDTFVSVNISALQFRANLLDVVNNALYESGLDPRKLELEITETTMMSDLNQTVSLLKELATRGINTAIDDFGTGHSSLYYLKTFPINTLKIDRSFVNDILNDENDANIVATVINMAQNLSLDVVAEGVEDEGQLQFLKDHGCPQVQGFYYSKPLPAAEYTEFLKRMENK